MFNSGKPENDARTGDSNINHNHNHHSNNTSSSSNNNSNNKQKTPNDKQINKLNKQAPNNTTTIPTNNDNNKKKNKKVQTKTAAPSIHISASCLYIRSREKQEPRQVVLPQQQQSGYGVRGLKDLRFPRIFNRFPRISMDSQRKEENFRGFSEAFQGFPSIFRGFPSIVRARTARVQGSRASRLKNWRSSGFEILGLGLGFSSWLQRLKPALSKALRSCYIPFQIPQNSFKTILSTIKTLPNPTLQHPVSTTRNPTKAIQNPTEALQHHVKPRKIKSFQILVEPFDIK